MDRHESGKKSNGKKTMNRKDVRIITSQQRREQAQYLGHHITMRLDESVPLQTQEWKTVEQLLMRMTEFAPRNLVTELLSSVADYADDQARRGYILGQEDLMHEVTKELR